MRVDPIVILAGATAKQGNRMFAQSLLDAEGGVVYCALMQAEEANLYGLDDITTAMILDDRAQCGALK